MSFPSPIGNPVFSLSLNSIACWLMKSMNALCMYNVISNKDWNNNYFLNDTP